APPGACATGLACCGRRSTSTPRPPPSLTRWPVRCSSASRPRLLLAPTRLRLVRPLIPADLPLLVSVHDPADQLVTHHVVAGQRGEVHVVDVFQDLPYHPQAGLLTTRQVDLRHVAGDP